MAPGQPESRYTVVRRLARGGMADVYLAVLRGAHGFEKQTILKRMREELADHEEYRKMFIDEARLMASLSHANIVGVLDFGDGADGIFLALEYVDGLDLAKVLARVGTLEPAMAIYVGSCVLHGLAYVHGRTGPDGSPLHVVHRDVSPANVFLGRNGDVKLGDFGVAKTTRASVQTVPGTIKGKLAYMSPEQASAYEVDERSDLFSMGVVLFEALTGQRPFTADTDLELLRRLIEDAAPDPLQLAPGLPPRLAAFLRRALARERRERFQTAEEMASALLACGEGPPKGPADVARLVASDGGAADAPSDPFAAALGRSADPRPPTQLTHTVPARPRGAGPPLRRGGLAGWAATAAAALAVIGGVWASSWKAPPPVAPALVARAEPPPALPPPPLAVEVDAGLAEAPAPDAGTLPLAGPLKAPRPPRGKATIDVNSTPWAKVYLDNKFVGDTAVTGLSVAAGRHRLALKNPGAGKSFETTIELAPGEHRVFPVDLERGVLTEAP